MKKVLLIITLTFSVIFRGGAEEGMLIPSLIAAFEDDMKAMGMKLSASDIYSVNESSIKDAIFHFGGGCTAALVSSMGLLLTNHHCGYSQVQSHSSLENDYIKYGFWAKSKDEELPNPGLTAARVVRIEDKTADVLFGTEHLTGDALEIKIEENILKLVQDAKAGTHYGAEIKPFNYGNDYYLIVKEVFTDVRLVGAPPSSVGKFGGDTDNWVWPRHTGDFSVFRIYAGVDNKPAEYSTSNKPYAPLHYFPISVKDRIPGEFTMVYGFPGTTEQHLSSAHLKYIMDRERPARIRMRDQSLAVMDGSMKSSDLLRIKYASKQARIANGWKKWIGQIGGLQTVNAIQVKLDRERIYNEQAASKPEWKEKYGSVINKMNALVEKYEESDFSYAMAIEYLYIGPEIFKRARAMEKFASGYQATVDLGALDTEVEELRKAANHFFKDYDEETDRKIFAKVTKEYIAQMQGISLSGSMQEANDIDLLANGIYASSVLTNPGRFEAFLGALKLGEGLEKLEKDPGYQLWKELSNDFYTRVIPDVRIFNAEMDELLKVYVAGKKEMFPEDKLWPDANSTMRITYGMLEGSAPHDGMKYTEHTTLEGILAKNNSGNADFELLPEFRVLAESADYGNYDQNGELWVCFTGSNHTTGGNSGSPVIDAEGNLMGLNFDRSWESTMSDFMFDANRCRNIIVDVRYVLWIMDKYAGAKHLVDEMELVDETDRQYKKRAKKIRKRNCKKNTCKGK